MLSVLFREFFRSEKTGGVILILCTVFSLLISNSSLGSSYISFWDTHIDGHSLTQWINDGLMTIFFLLIGLELEREIYKGELSNIKNALLPVIAATGGMLIPAGIHLLFNYGTQTQSGAGIPMATDIAFAIGVLSLFGKRVPASLKIFLTALAVIDDLGAIITIATFYTHEFSFTYLLLALGVMLILFVCNRLRIHYLLPYLTGGIFMWYFMSMSGVHPTITGVLLAFVIPFGNGDERTISYRLQHALHVPVSYIILPVFALANTCMALSEFHITDMAKNNNIGIVAGLVIGKPLGIFLFSFASVVLGLCSLPQGMQWKHIIGAGMLGGIGFTMSVFITLLAFDDAAGIIEQAKISILLASLVAALCGLLFLAWALPKGKELLRL